MGHYDANNDDSTTNKGVAFYSYKGDIIDFLYDVGIYIEPENIQFKRIPHKGFVYNVYYKKPTGKLIHTGLHLHFTHIQHKKDQARFFLRMYKTILKSYGGKK